MLVRRGDLERRLGAQLLTLMDGLEPRRNVVVIGATNAPEVLDEALRRPGRFDRVLFVAPPDQAARAAIIRSVRPRRRRRWHLRR